MGVGQPPPDDTSELDDLLARRGELDGSSLDHLADALFWCDRLPESLGARRDAYRHHVADGDDRRAALTTWRLFYEHFLIGESAIAAGWLERCRAHADHVDDPVVAGWLRLADGDVAARDGRLAEALDAGAEVCDTGRRVGDADLLAMGLQLLGRARIDDGDRTVGLNLLDEAMVAVVNDELTPLFTGWVYCNVVATCYGLADLQRASEWSAAAMRWCATLREGRMYRGLCRVYAVELAALRGEWESAATDAELACRELTAHDPRYAGAAYYLVGELRRRLGARDEARTAFARAHELGVDPQPGHALLEADEGRPEDALATLVNALRPGPGAPLPRARLLTAVIDVADESADHATIDGAAGELAELAAEHGGDVLEAAADAARGRRLLARGDAREAIDPLRRAVDAYVRLGLPYDAARRRVDLARAAQATGDVGTARLELGTARAAFDRLGAGPDAADADHRLRDLETAAAPEPRAAVLTSRELDVLRLVADGCTNRAIATELYLSPHTVARHVSNVLTKLDVHSRAAAVATAVERGWLDNGG